MKKSAIILFAIIAIILFWVVYFFTQNQAKITPTVSQVNSTPTAIISPNPVADWKTYTNSKYGFSVSYPASWGIDSGDDIVNLMSNPDYITARQKWDAANNGPDFQYPSDNYGAITFSVYPLGIDTAAGKVTVQTDIRQFVAKMFGSMVYTSIKDITVNGKPAVEFTSDELMEKPGLPPHMQECPPANAPCFIPDGHFIKQVWTKINGNLFYASYSQGGSYTEIDKLPGLFDQIMATFKF